MIRSSEKNFIKLRWKKPLGVNNLITELLDLVKTRETRFSFNDIHDLIDRMILLVSPESNAKEIEVVRHYSPDISQAWMDYEKMKEVGSKPPVKCSGIYTQQR